MIALALGLSILIGLTLGLLGGGGSILTIPILTYVVGMDAKPAIATSLFVVGVTSAVAIVPHARARRVAWRVGLTFGIAGMSGAYLGGRVAAFIPGPVLLTGFGLMMLATALAMLRGRTIEQPVESAELPGRARMIKAIAIGLGVGVVTGLLGAGGGFLVVPALVLFGGMPIKRAIGTSLVVIAMQAFAGLAGYIGHVPIAWHLAFAIAAVAVVGCVIGGLLVRRVPQVVLRKGFAGFVLAMAAVVIATQISAVTRASSVYRALFVERWPWWAGGIAIAAVGFGLLFFTNKQLGVSTGCHELCQIHKHRAARDSWRPRFLLGIVLGGALSSFLAGRAPTLAFGSFDALFGTNLALKLGVLSLAGVMIGLGARLAGGCTSGHSIVGTALGARSSWLATALFMVAGFASTNLVFWLSGGLPR